MKRKSVLSALLALLLIAMAVFTGCAPKETVTKADTLEGVRELVRAFYGPLSEADPIRITTLSDSETASVFTVAGDRFCMESSFYDDPIYCFVEDGVSYVVYDGVNASESDMAYEMYAMSKDFTIAMITSGFLEDPEEGEDTDDDGLTYSATRTDKTENGVALSELVYTISGEQEGETLTLIVTGKAENGAVKSAVYAYESEEENDGLEYRFEYDGVAVELPEGLVMPEPPIELEWVSSPYDTFQDLADLLDEDESLMTMMMYREDDTIAVYATGESDGRELLFEGTISQEDYDAIDEIDWMADDYEAQRLAILGQVPIDNCYDLSPLILSQSELDEYVGKTVGNLIDDGFESAGWSIWEEGSVVFVERDSVSYYVEIELPEGFDADAEFEFEDLYDAKVVFMEFDEIQLGALLF